MIEFRGKSAGAGALRAGAQAAANCKTKRRIDRDVTEAGGCDCTRVVSSLWLGLGAGSGGPIKGEGKLDEARRYYSKLIRE